MLTTEEAVSLIDKHIDKFRELINDTDIAFLNANQTIALEDIKADRGHPPFHRVAMDGIALKIESFKKGLRKFAIEGIQKAGEPSKKLLCADSCLEAMTGAVLPENTNIVIPYEKIQIHDGTVTINEQDVDHFQNIHIKDSDYKTDDTLIKANQQITAPHIGILASIGKSNVTTKSVPKIAIISTGDELVDVNEVPQEHQIRKSNVYAVQALLSSFGFTNNQLFHIKDDKDALRKNLASALQNFDCLILSGGVSMGKFDFVPQILNDLNVKNIFHKVAQRPGKPIWFGVSNRGQFVFGLPGNPISALVCARRYCLPALLKASGTHSPFILKAILTEEIKFNKPLTFFSPVKVHVNDQAQILAQPIKFNGSGDFASLGESDGIIELPQNQSIFCAGQVYSLYLWTRTFYGYSS